MLFEKIFVKIEKDITYLSVDNPKSLNAIDMDVMNELEYFFKELKKKPPKMLVLHAKESKSVVSGGDLKAFSKLITKDEGMRMSRKMIQVIKIMNQIPTLTIAALNGMVFGGGVEFALAFDIRFGFPNTKIGLTQANFALPPGWNGLMRLNQLLRRDQILYLLTSRKILNVEEALKFGLITAELNSENDLRLEIEKISELSSQMINRIKQSQALFDEDKWNQDLADAEINLFGDAWASDAHHSKVAEFLNRKSK